MSWMRAPFYVWSDGDTAHISEGGGWGTTVRMPEETLEELAVMVTLELLLDREDDKGWDKLVEVATRAHQKHGGNFGCDGASILIGEETSLDRLHKTVERLRAEREDPLPSAPDPRLRPPEAARRRWFRR